MNAAHDIHANQPQPFTGRAVPPDRIQADNDDAVTCALRALPDIIFRAVMGYRLHQRKAQLRYDAQMSRRRVAEMVEKPVAPPRDAEARIAHARDLRSKAARLRSDDARGNRAEIKDLETRATLAEREAQEMFRDALENDWARRAGEETDQLAEARGEGVVLTREGKRIMARNGIVQAYRSGYLEPTLPKMGEMDLYGAAKLYRACACVIAGMTTPERGEGGFNAKGPQVRVIEAGEALAVMRTGLTKFQVEVLDRVCGLDMRAREVATVLHRGFPAVRTALSEGLSMVVVNLRAERTLRKKQGDEPTVAQQIVVKHTAIVAAQRAA